VLIAFAAISITARGAGWEANYSDSTTREVSLYALEYTDELHAVSSNETVIPSGAVAFGYIYSALTNGETDISTSRTYYREIGLNTNRLLVSTNSTGSVYITTNCLVTLTRTIEGCYRSFTLFGNDLFDYDVHEAIRERRIVAGLEFEPYLSIGNDNLANAKAAKGLLYTGAWILDAVGCSAGATSKSDLFYLAKAPANYDAYTLNKTFWRGPSYSREMENGLFIYGVGGSDGRVFTNWLNRYSGGSVEVSGTNREHVTITETNSSVWANYSGGWFETKDYGITNIIRILNLQTIYKWGVGPAAKVVQKSETIHETTLPDNVGAVGKIGGCYTVSYIDSAANASGESSRYLTTNCNVFTYTTVDISSSPTNTVSTNYTCSTQALSSFSIKYHGEYTAMVSEYDHSFAHKETGTGYHFNDWRHADNYGEGIDSYKLWAYNATGDTYRADEDRSIESMVSKAKFMYGVKYTKPNYYEEYGIRVFYKTFCPYSYGSGDLLEYDNVAIYVTNINRGITFNCDIYTNTYEIFNIGTETIDYGDVIFNAGDPDENTVRVARVTSDIDGFKYPLNYAGMDTETYQHQTNSIESASSTFVSEDIWPGGPCDEDHPRFEGAMSEYEGRIFNYTEPAGLDASVILLLDFAVTDGFKYY